MREICCLLLWAIASFQAAAQVEYPYRFEKGITLTDDRYFQGLILEEDTAQVKLRSIGIRRDVAIPRPLIKEIRDIRPWAPSTGAYTNMLSPVNGLNLNKGELYYQNVMVGVNTFAYGITDRLSVTAGFELISTLLTVDQGPTFAISPKYTVPLIEDELYLGAGAFLMRLPGYEGFFTHSFAFASLTHGNRYSNITAGLSYMYKEGEFFPSPIFMLSGHKRTSERFAIHGELWLGPIVEGASFLPGVQFFGHRLDFAASLLISYLDEVPFVSPIPLIKLGVKFPE